MDPRYKTFYLYEADAIHRQEMGRLAHAVAAGMSDKSGFRSFIDNLELTESGVTMKADETLMNKVMSRLKKWR